MSAGHHYDEMAWPYDDDEPQPDPVDDLETTGYYDEDRRWPDDEGAPF